MTGINAKIRRMSREGLQCSTVLLIAVALVVTGCTVAMQPSASTSMSPASPQASMAGSGSAAHPDTRDGKAIGTAKLKADGTLVVTLYAQGSMPAQLFKKYAEDDPKREIILEHIGGLALGEEKLVPPWPDNIDDARVDAAVRTHIAKHSWGGSARIVITGTDKQGRIAVTAVDASAPGGGVSLRLDPDTYEVVDEYPLRR